ncbi:hypothetical protein DMUE_3937, partial [Dictyocoela muelleri]
MICLNNEISEYRSIRDGRIVIFKDFIYNIETKIDKNIRWRCQVRTCREKMITNINMTLISETIHNHPPDKSKVIRLKTNSEILERYINTREPAHEIISKMNVKIPTENIEYMNRYRSLIDRVAKIRNRKLENF